MDVIIDQIAANTADDENAYGREDLAVKALCYRLRRIAHHVETQLRRELASFGIELWELELLAYLHRSGSPFEATAGALQDAMQLTTGAVTKRVSALERRGWVERSIDPRDRRQILVRLTDEGESRAMEVFRTKTETESRLIATLTPQQLERLNAELHQLLLDMEGPIAD
ncbi:MarR family winged helix-turn-helix transcriptional regulator [Nocardia sp. CDC160]|uniref:MarR family winged helix-turn-helix transcriptional regulator n=1 Tax=Nocardia sp. CDC160 TaxID=3112166 RepID=UPI002DB5C28A|nr:MarR family transcriptional regulator [Nocardia sp. CDC160]MEC3915952.1 MarR family transcriptional regulator [Nocardia sp. CDC160]